MMRNLEMSAFFWPMVSCSGDTEIPYWRQGNLDMYSEENVTKRRRLKGNPDIENMLRMVGFAELFFSATNLPLLPPDPMTRLYGVKWCPLSGSGTRCATSNMWEWTKSRTVDFSSES